MSLAVVPINRPLSRATIGTVDDIGEEEAKTAVAAAQNATSHARRKAMITKGNGFRISTGRTLSLKYIHRARVCTLLTPFRSHQ